MDIRESQVEDVLATYPHVTQNVLRLADPLSLLGRQMILPSGRLDMLFASGNRLLLLELKVEKCQDGFVEQIAAYRRDLVELQDRHMLVQGEIDAILLCPEVSAYHAELCHKHGVMAVVYSPADVLQSFFYEVQKASVFMAVRPMDSGLWSIHLINRVVYALVDNHETAMLSRLTGLSPRSIANHLRFAAQLCLVQEQDTHPLTDLGQRYVLAQDPRLPFESVSEEQARLLRDFILKDPFVTPTVFGIYQMVEAVYALSRNIYPVPMELAQPYFRDACGKRYLWQTEKSVYHGTRMYSNYGIELGLLGKMGDKLLLTPNGMRFILLLQLHKGIRMVDAL